MTDRKKVLLTGACGISDNPHAFWSIANARRIIGYAPQDNSEIRFRDLIAEHIAAATEAGEA